MCKKVFIIAIIAINIIIANLRIVKANEIEENEDADLISEIKTIDVSVNLEKEPEINSRAAIIYNRDSKEIIWSKNCNERKKMASTTKIMTAIIVLENCNIYEIATVSKKAAGTGGSRLGLKTDDKVIINDLLYGLLLVSGNDAAVALAEYTAGSIENFANMMNEKAKVLNLKDTNFVTPHGLDSDEHYTTAYELAQITDYALNNKKFAEIVNTKKATITVNGYSKALSNTNELLGNLNGVNGVKTGFTNGANRCLVTSVSRNNMNIITVVLGADTKKMRTTDSVKLIEYAYGNYKNVAIKDMINEKYNQWKVEREKNIIINKGIKEMNTVLEEYEKEAITIKNTEENDIQIIIENENNFEAPICENEVIGEIKLFVGEKEKLSINILNKENISKMTTIDFYISLIKNNWKMVCEMI